MSQARTAARRVLRRIAARAVRGPWTGPPSLARYAPQSTLSLPAHRVQRASVPAVDAHNHLGRWLHPNQGWMAPDVGQLLRVMDAANLQAVVNLDGRWAAELDDNLDRYDRAHPGRFATFCHVDWTACATDRFDAVAADLARSLDQGAAGLKVWKDLGRSVRDARGQLVLPGDPRLAALWETAADAGIPVLIHTADPVAHFQPVNRHNERLEELRRFPGASWRRGDLPDHRTLMASFEQLVATHPRTTFIAAHVAGWAENLQWVQGILDRYPNVHVDISARVGDLGRQPRAATGLLAGHSDRVLFGTDVYPVRPKEIEIYFRFLETEDERFPYSTDDPPRRGRWDISGVGLDAATLAAIYRDNALRLVPALRDQ